MNVQAYPFYEPAQVLGEHSISLQEFAQYCRMTTQWVVEHVHTGVITYDVVVVEGMTSPSSAPELPPEQWRFSSHTLVRARRIADLEHSFDADPQLAALTADLLEEVLLLRRQLQQQHK